MTLKASLCSGFGQWHTDKPNNQNSKPYNTITLENIVSMVENPTSTAKENAAWFIPSSLLTREAAKQREHGVYFAVWCDFDNHTELSAILAVLAVLSCAYVVYSSRSATKERQKWRVIIPLATPATANEWQQVAAVINDRFEAAEIVPDRASERINQICYLPNRGEYYQSHIERGALLDWQTVLADELTAKKQHAANELTRLNAVKEQSRLKAVQRMATGSLSPIDAFNAAYPVEQCLELYGYKRNGNKWLSPNSSSGNAGVSVKGDKWISSHSSDLNLGSPNPNGSGCNGDAFDLFTYYEHGGNRNAAIKAAGAMFSTSSGKTISQANQQGYKQQNNTIIPYYDANADYDDSTIMPLIDNPSDTMAYTNKQLPTIGSATPTLKTKPAFSLGNFSLNGHSQEMKKKMLDDKFVLDKIAILGQATAIYAKPNTGKTLLVLWLLIQAISEKCINGDNVYYINADDNYKGLVTKLVIAEKYGFQMLAPGQNGFESNALMGYMRQMINDNTAHGAVIILDTLKKFTNLMDKKTASDFMKRAREFVTIGGTIIMLAHTNKKRGDDGKVIFAGTSDVIDDCDCAFTIDELKSAQLLPTSKTVLFENLKSRGDVADELAFSYSIVKDGKSYQDLLESVKIENRASTEQVKKELLINSKRKKDQPLIDAITEAIEQGKHLKTDLIEFAHKSIGISKPKLIKILDEYKGTKFSDLHLWRESKGEKNAKNYYLLTDKQTTATEYILAKDGY
jgi:hypothetical protein